MGELIVILVLTLVLSVMFAKIMTDLGIPAPGLPPEIAMQIWKQRKYNRR
jgi:hypothetical protein